MKVVARIRDFFWHGPGPATARHAVMVQSLLAGFCEEQRYRVRRLVRTIPTSFLFLILRNAGSDNPVTPYTTTAWLPNSVMRRSM